MNRRQIVRWTLSAFLCSLPVFPVSAQDNVRRDAVLAQMNKASADFHNATADFSWDYYQAAVKETSTQTGRIYFERSKAGGLTGVQMGAVVLDAHGKPKQILEYKGGQLRYYEVPANQVRVLNAGSNQAQYESFLTLGFGGSGADLERDWNVGYAGSETLQDDGKPVKTEKLELVSKSPQVAQMFTKVTIWIDAARGVSLKQVFDTPSHDRRTATYAHIQRNGNVNHGPFEISRKAVVLK